MGIKPGGINKIKAKKKKKKRNKCWFWLGQYCIVSTEYGMDKRIKLYLLVKLLLKQKYYKIYLLYKQWKYLLLVYIYIYIYIYINKDTHVFI